MRSIKIKEKLTRRVPTRENENCKDRTPEII
jgi:hypothetical protein